MNYLWPDKRCCRCNLLKPISRFSKATARKSGLQPYCKFCESKSKKKYRDSLSPDKRAKRSEYMLNYMRLRLTELKKIVYDHYGNSCTKCGEDKMHVLTIEHIGGLRPQYRHPSGKRKRGLNLYRLIIKENFPDYITVLCFNCNIGGYIEQSRTPS